MTRKRWENLNTVELTVITPELMDCGCNRVQLVLITQKRSLLKVCWGAPDLRGTAPLSRAWPEVVWWLALSPV